MPNWHRGVLIKSNDLGTHSHDKINNSFAPNEWLPTIRSPCINKNNMSLTPLYFWLTSPDEKPFQWIYISYWVNNSTMSRLLNSRYWSAAEQTVPPNPIAIGMSPCNEIAARLVGNTRQNGDAAEKYSEGKWALNQIKLTWLNCVVLISLCVPVLLKAVFRLWVKRP